MAERERERERAAAQHSHQPPSIHHRGPTSSAFGTRARSHAGPGIYLWAHEYDTHSIGSLLNLSFSFLFFFVNIPLISAECKTSLRVRDDASYFCQKQEKNIESLQKFPFISSAFRTLSEKDIQTVEKSARPRNTFSP